MDNQEVNFRDVVSKMQEFVKLLFSKWLIILIAGILGGVLGLLYAWNAKPNYSASLNFVLANNSQSGGNLLGLANQFGINLGNGDDNMFSGDNIITLMKSRRMVQQALFKKPDNSNESLLNILIRDKKLNKSWQKNERTKKAYPFPDDPSKMTLIQDSLFRDIYSNVQKEMLNVTKPDKNQNIYAVVTTSKNPEFSYYLTKDLVAVTSTFYIDTKTSTAKQNLYMLQKEADSLRIVLGGAITSAGSQTDYTFNLNPAYQVQRSGAQQSQARAGALGQAYGQVLQNLELAKITLQKETPLYLVIDEPTLPLEADKPGKFSSILVGGFLGGIVIILILGMNKIYLNYFKKT
jgi:uncharacterized protein involved in exopolysaccharide biosynthesis